MDSLADLILILTEHCTYTNMRVATLFVNFQSDISVEFSL